MFPASIQDWWLFAGKFHPMVVHFPIALLLVASLIEFFRLRRGDRTPSHAASICLGIGAVSAVVAAAAGWSDAVTSGHSGSDAWVLFTHRWLGVAAAGISVLVVLLALLAKTRNTARPFAWYRLGLITSAVLVAVAGHFGASLIYGTSYIPDSWTKAREGAASRFAAAEKAPIPSGAAPVAFNATVDFARQVQPILAKRCYQCHAGDKPESELRLDTRSHALKGGKSGHPAIVAGNAAASEMIKLIKGLDPKRQMPPKGGALDSSQIATLEAWIAQGARWDGATDGEHWHWAYRAPVRANPPPVRDTHWPRNPIDSFVLARLEAEKLTPSPEAERETLIRRVTLDLTGLPPTPAEIDAFLADSSGGAYERVVSRLLDSPAYGERMAMKWLDLARYADTHGYEKDDRRTMWPYRDWVIDAFNRDLPYDRFTIEQLAGDLLAEPTTEQLIATGFNRNTQINEEGGVDAEEFRVDAVIDRTNTVGTVWLGSTVGCAQCHNHKNDPITQEEYYRFLAYFNSDDADVTLHSTGATAAGGMLPISQRENRAEFAKLPAEIADLRAQLAAFPESEIAAAQAAWEKDFARRQPAWAVLKASRVESLAGATLTRQEDGSYLASGKDADRETYSFESPVELAATTALRLELFPDASLPGKGVGRSSHSNIVLQDFKVEVAYPKEGGLGEFEAVPLVQGAADHEQGLDKPGDQWPIGGAIDADPKTGWAIGPKVKESHTAVFRLGKALGGGAGSSGSSAVVRVTMVQNYGHHVIGRFRLSVTNDPEPLGSASISPEITQIVAIAAPERDEGQRAKLAAYYRSISPALRPIRDRLAAATLSRRQGELTVAKAMVMKRAGTAQGDASVSARELPEPGEEG